MRCATHLFALLAMAGSAGFTVTVGQSAAAQAPVHSQRSAWSGVYSEEQAERGAKIFRKACGYCHRDNLGGDYGPPLVGVDFTYPWDGRTLGELYDTMSSTMPPASAVDRVVLQPSDYVDILSFILRSNGLPPGVAELPTDAGRLRGIVFTRRATP
jgi:mono/diheme cytochrome c family protein